MFDDYTIDQILELRNVCAYTVEHGNEPETRADALLVLEFIEEELAIRQRRKSA